MADEKEERFILPAVVCCLWEWQIVLLSHNRTSSFKLNIVLKEAYRFRSQCYPVASFNNFSHSWYWCLRKLKITGKYSNRSQFVHQAWRTCHLQRPHFCGSGSPGWSWKWSLQCVHCYESSLWRRTRQLEGAWWHLGTTQTARSTWTQQKILY